MAEATTTVGLGRRMTYEQFLELPDDMRAEYSGGEAIMTPAPSFRHQKACRAMADLLTDQLAGGAVVALAVGWSLASRSPTLRIPDVLVLAEEPDGDLVTAAPVVVVEVLSTNRGNDLVRKSAEYLAAGAGQYWVVDPRDRVVSVYARADGAWDLVAEVTDATPTATVTVAPWGTVTLDIAALLG